MTLEQLKEEVELIMKGYALYLYGKKTKDKDNEIIGIVAAGCLANKLRKDLKNIFKETGYTNEEVFELWGKK
jgi:hypothetical protein